MLCGILRAARLPQMEKPELTFEFESDQDRQLFKLQLRVAQRADELTRLLKNPGQAFELWRQAESEILSAAACVVPNAL
jgi:hypothetical protein